MKNNNNKIDQKTLEVILDNEELVKTKIILLKTQQITMGFSFLGLIMATAFGLTAYVFVGNNLSRLIYFSSAMGCLVGAAVGINLIDRLRKKSTAPFYAALVFLLLIIAGLIGVYIKAEQFNFRILWPPLVSAAFNSIMCGIIWRLKSSTRDFSKIKGIVNYLNF
ncbi:MAG: hypothetical protein PF689_02625 [Deltaproteobacteria bacterium]|jgi:hypothetical protein|nr:hypothetical protein [Deltaproteobacteria bacterium]